MLAMPARLADAAEDGVEHVEQEGHLVDGEVIPLRGGETAAGAQQQAQLVQEGLAGDTLRRSRDHHIIPEPHAEASTVLPNCSGRTTASSVLTMEAMLSPCFSRTPMTIALPPLTLTFLPMG